MTKLRVLDLFSGIGGFSLGLERSMSILTRIRHAIAAWRFNGQFKEYDKEIARLRKQHKRGVLEATAAKRHAVNMALAGKTLVKL